MPVSQQRVLDWRPPVRWLPTALRQPRSPLLAIGIGWVAAFFPSILAAAAVQALVGGQAGPEIKGSGASLLFMLVVFAPVAETLIMAAVLALLLRFLTPTAAVIVSALGWGVAHSAMAPAWGLVIWWPFLIFSTLFVAWRQRSLFAALAVPASVHALHNLLPGLMIAGGLGR